MNQIINIRRAQKNDAPAMMQLIQELAAYERAPDAVTVTMSEFMDSGFGAQPVWWAFVAEAVSDNVAPQVVGFALYYIRYSTWKGRRLYLEDIIVTEPYRQQGIGHMLMQALIKEMYEKGFHGMNWQVLEWNQPAISFYKTYPTEFDNEWINVALNKQYIDEDPHNSK